MAKYIPAPRRMSIKPKTGADISDIEKCDQPLCHMGRNTCAHRQTTSLHAYRTLSASTIDLLAVFIHPPAVPEGFTALSWLPRVHFACAQVLAQIDDGWDYSTRKKALLAVLLGPADWPTVAVIQALTQIALKEPAFSWRIEQAFLKLSKRRPGSGACCWDLTLYRSWIRLPHLFDEERQELTNQLRNIESDYRISKS